MILSRSQRIARLAETYRRQTVAMNNTAPGRLVKINCPFAASDWCADRCDSAAAASQTSTNHAMIPTNGTAAAAASAAWGDRKTTNTICALQPSLLQEFVYPFVHRFVLALQPSQVLGLSGDLHGGQ